MEEKQPNFIIGVKHICEHFNFGREFFFECIRLGLPYNKLNNRYVVVVKNVEDFFEQQMESNPKKDESFIPKTSNKIKYSVKPVKSVENIDLENDDLYFEKSSSVYFVQSILGGPIKIGITEDWGRRYIQMQKVNPFKMRLLLLLKNRGLKLETDLHLKFDKCRSHGEWYFPNTDLVKFIETNRKEI